ASGDSLVVVSAARPSRNATSFADSLAQALPAQCLTRLDLGPLTSDEALELAKTLAPNIGGDAARALAERSGGSPFWLDALARGGGVEVDTGRLVTARLRGASADAGALLAALAIAARPLALASAAELNDWAQERAEHAARELVTRGIAVESGGALRLAHDLIRVAAVGETPDEQPVRIHRRVSGVRCAACARPWQRRDRRSRSMTVTARASIWSAHASSEPVTRSSNWRSTSSRRSWISGAMGTKSADGRWRMKPPRAHETSST